MIFITGDIHGDPGRLNPINFPEQSEMTKDDYVIILGDFGLVWANNEESEKERYWLDWLEEKPFTTLFICGNHENYDRLNAYPIEFWRGGRVHKIRPHVIHLMRGEVFNIDNKNIFTFGGAQSQDIRDGILDAEKDIEKIIEWQKDRFKMFRVNHVSWWKEELPSNEEMQHGIETLNKHNWKVDYVLTHSPCASTLALMGRGFYKQDILTIYLEEIRTKLDYDRWFFGHMHVDMPINNQEFAMYTDIIRIN